mmetsp:Transcript_25511/g.75833  ORF Transcript_25511/g.75833 Transcript_25511/m.75833 type:complete len:239 (+) Transcript_25511:5797-6513(+)
MPARSGRTCAATGAARPGSTRHRPHLCPQPERERCRWPRKRVGHHRRPQGRHGHLCCLWRLEDPARRSGRLARLAPGGRGRAGGGGASRPTVFPRQRAQRMASQAVLRLERCWDAPLQRRPGACGCGGEDAAGGSKVHRTTLFGAGLQVRPPLLGRRGGLGGALRLDVRGVPRPLLLGALLARQPRQPFRAHHQCECAEAIRRRCRRRRQAREQGRPSADSSLLVSPARRVACAIGGW